MAEVGQAHSALSPALSREVVLGVGGVQERVEAAVVKQAAWKIVFILFMFYKILIYEGSPPTVYYT